MAKTLSLVTMFGAILCMAGCADPEPQPVARRVAVSPSGAEVNSAPGSEETAAPKIPTQTPAPETPAPPVIAVGKEAFLAAHRRVAATSIELMKTLDGVTDEASAQAAAPRLAALTQEWKSTATAATAAFLLLSNEQQDAAMSEGAQEATEPDIQMTHGTSPYRQIQRIARSPAGPVLQNELRELRDTWLSTRGPYSPVLARKRIVEQLGPAGSPIKTD